MTQATKEKMYLVRCSPDCPYPDCVILTATPPPKSDKQQQQGEPQDNQQGQQNTQQSDQGEGQSQNSQSSSSQDNQQSSQSQDKSQDKQDSSQSPQNQQNQKDGKQDDKVTPPPKSDKQQQQGEPEKSEEQKQREEEQRKAEEERRKEREQQEKEKQEAQQPQPVDVKPGTKYAYEFLPDNFTSTPTHSKGAGNDNTGIADLGKHMHREKIVTDAVFQAKLSNVLKDNAFDRPVKGRKRGKLDMRALYRVPMKAENVFTLKEARKNKHYNVILLVDQSGSMYVETNDPHNWNDTYYEGTTVKGRERIIDNAADVATFLARSLGKVGVDYAIIGYSGGWGYHKKFNQPATDDKLKKIKYDIVHTGGGGTVLLRPLKEAMNALKGREGKNIIISINDGDPDAKEYVKQYVKGNTHIAEYIDIGIAHEPLIPSGFRVNNAQEVKPLLIKQLQRRIRRG